VVAAGVTDSDRTTREPIADRLRCDERVFGLDELRVAAAVAGEHVVVRNCAGPSVDTCRPVVEGCHQAGPRVLDGDADPGFRTPGGRFGPDFLLGIEGVEREDVA